MSEKFYSLVTKIGQAQFANALALDQKVAFGTFAVGDGGGSIYEPSEDQTELKHEVWSGKITSLTIGENNPNELVVETYIPSNKGGFTIREFGIKDSDGNLLVVGKHPETYKPIAADGTAKDITLRVILAISNAEEVILKIDPSVQVATRQDLEKVKADFDAAKGSLASRKDFEDFKTSFEEEKKDLASKKTLDKHIGDTSLHTTKEDKAKLKAIPTNPKYTDTTYIFDKGLSLAGGKVSAKLGDGLVFDTTGNIKAGDSLARKSYVDSIKTKLTTDIGIKADKSDLNNYVEKVEGKGLSTNDFTDDLKNRINRDLRTDVEVVNLARMAVEKEKMFKSGKLYSILNGFYGTNLSSSINTLDDLSKSDSAMAEILNNKNIQTELDENLVVANLIYNNVFPYFKGGKNLSEFKKHLRQDIRTKALYNNPKYVDLIIKNKELLDLISTNEELTTKFVNNNKYLYRIFASYDNPIESNEGYDLYKNHNKFIFLSYDARRFSSSPGVSEFLEGLNNGTNRDWNNFLQLGYDSRVSELQIYKTQEKNGELWKYKLGDKNIMNFNIFKECGLLEFKGFKKFDLKRKWVNFVLSDNGGYYVHEFVKIDFIDVQQLEEDLAREA